MPPFPNLLLPGRSRRCINAGVVFAVPPPTPEATQVAPMRTAYLASIAWLQQ
ncbi:uncharacterized protein SCHCODRAFT_02634211 [Schizophyllum commune H4-8]|uniref:uncharacterized protein n=1 Tax=Schizophyllum commune (strain H4-8 / FGSC 9210) TaxID=578458 RepID=UPI00215F4C74|nr:uncharacterized protein SCHCODRAFT_02634211 [Schizophyllum commune H4-8]KAI5889335.1 hypothetical protein SCHCODRAFT_02634211 [Schizophyllum commune H4-8]